MRYQDKTCLVATMHEKQKAIQPAFESLLGFQIEVGSLNTDILGTFTGEIERVLSPLECAKAKCLEALLKYGKQIGIANEGSFHPHPLIPLVSIEQEIFFFTDLEMGYHLFVTKIFTETNFNIDSFSEFDSVVEFGRKALFPSHALILRPNIWEEKSICFKGIQSIQELYSAFEQARFFSKDGQVRIETDMRAHKNPTRMKNLTTFAEEMAYRLATACPVCSTPGWGLIETKRGLPCLDCGTQTELVYSVVWGCCRCSHRELKLSNQTGADPQYCPFCNP